MLQSKWSIIALFLLLGSLQVDAIGYVYTGVGRNGRDLMELTRVHGAVRIQDRVAITRVDQIFPNHSNREVEAIYELTTLPKMEERFVLPPYHREMDIEALNDPLAAKGEMGFGSLQPPVRGA